MTGERPRRAPVNTVVRWLVHTSLLRRLLDRWVCELRFVAPRTGRDVVLPVMYAEAGEELFVLVGRAQSKRWWRNFARPHPVHVWIHGQSRPGTGHLARPGSVEHGAAAAIYRARYGKVHVADNPFVVISLDRRGS
jgi:hypothetical protein